MFLRASNRKKNGKTHTYWSIVENRRLPGDRVVQRHVLYLGEINSSQEYAWRKSIEVFSEDQSEPQTLSLFPEDPAPEELEKSIVRIHVDQISVHRCRQFGACWLASFLYYDLRLDWFWAERLPTSRKGTRWDLVLQTLVVYRLLAPGSEWFLHRHWFESTAMADLLAGDFRLVEIHKLYECLDQLCAYKNELMVHLKQRWIDLYNAQFRRIPSLLPARPFTWSTQRCGAGTESKKCAGEVGNPLDGGCPSTDIRWQKDRVVAMDGTRSRSAIAAVRVAIGPTQTASTTHHFKSGDRRGVVQTF